MWGGLPLAMTSCGAATALFDLLLIPELGSSSPSCCCYAAAGLLLGVVPTGGAARGERGGSTQHDQGPADRDKGSLLCSYLGISSMDISMDDSSNWHCSLLSALESRSLRNDSHSVTAFVVGRPTWKLHPTQSIGSSDRGTSLLILCRATPPM